MKFKLNKAVITATLLSSLITSVVPANASYIADNNHELRKVVLDYYVTNERPIDKIVTNIDFKTNIVGSEIQRNPYMIWTAVGVELRGDNKEADLTKVSKGTVTSIGNNSYKITRPEPNNFDQLLENIDRKLEKRFKTLNKSKMTTEDTVVEVGRALINGMTYIRQSGGDWEKSKGTWKWSFDNYLKYNSGVCYQQSYIYTIGLLKMGIPAEKIVVKTKNGGFHAITAFWDKEHNSWRFIDPFTVPNKNSNQYTVNRDRKGWILSKSEVINNKQYKLFLGDNILDKSGDEIYLIQDEDLEYIKTYFNQ